MAVYQSSQSITILPKAWKRRSEFQRLINSSKKYTFYVVTFGFSTGVLVRILKFRSNLQTFEKEFKFVQAHSDKREGLEPRQILNPTLILGLRQNSLNPLDSLMEL